MKGTLHSRRRKKPSLTSSVTQIGSNLLAAAGLIVTSQALYVAVTTPRLPPPENSGHDFEENGLTISYNDEVEDFQKGEDSEFRLLLLGDSPIEGIGNRTHEETLGGQTALAFSKLLGKQVRYWNYGKSGLTAEGIRKEMLPHLQRLTKRYRIDAVVVSCGVNNVLFGSSPATFGKEVRDLLCSIRLFCKPSTKILVMELLDFALMPFIPYPLRQIASWRSVQHRTEMDKVLKYFKELQNDGVESADGVELVIMPRIQEILGGERHKNPHLAHLTKEERDALTLVDFFADDNFHPANIGNVVAGSIIADTYSKLISTNK